MGLIKPLHQIREGEMGEEKVPIASIKSRQSPAKALRTGGGESPTTKKQNSIELYARLQSSRATTLFVFLI